MFIILIILVCLFLFFASYNLKAGIYLKSKCSNRESSELIAVTFDDGVDPDVTPAVLDVLRKHNVKCTFFVIGEKAQKYPELVKRIFDDGHDIGNHSFYHKGSFPMQTTKAIKEEICCCNNVIKKSVGEECILFRPPFGVTNPMIGKAVRETNMISIGWSIRSLDTIGQDIEKVRQRVACQLNGGDVILLHDNRKDAHILTEMILNDINKKGFKAVSVKQLFNIK